MVAQEREVLEKEVARLAKESYQCEADAQQALERFLQEYQHALHQLTGEIQVKEIVKRPPGRPRKNQVYPVETSYSVQVTVHAPDPNRIQELRERESAFVLITTLPEEEWSDGEVLREYKDQQAVERRLGFLQ